MIENVKGKLLLIFSVLAIAGIFLALGKVRPNLGLQLGLDLQGGQRYVYRLEFDEDQIANENPATLQRQTIEIIRDRIDPDGVLEPVLRPEGSNRIVIEIPGVDELQGAGASGALQRAVTLLGEDSLALRLDANYSGVFPASGGEVSVGAETVRYVEARAVKVGDEPVLDDQDEPVLDPQTGLELTRDVMGIELVVAEDGRGYQGTTKVEHPVGEPVSLISTNYIQNKIENLGQLYFGIVATPAMLNAGSGTDMESERAKLDAWFAEHSQATSLREFNALDPTQGGPHPWLRWVPEKRRINADGQVADSRTLAERARPLLRLENHPDYADRDWKFDGQRLKSAYPARDQRGLPAIGFEWQSRFAQKFGAFTGNFSDELMAIVLNEQIESAPQLNEPIYASGIIRSGSTPYRAEEVEEMVTVLRTGSLRVRPILESKETVGPTLGAAYVQRGWWSGGIGIGLVLAFMVWYYRRLGLISVVSLLSNMFILMGALSFLNATLTLPGIAGLILTIGMAVDANILIFDRIREERDNGRNVRQAAKNGFDKALSTIVDANLTTLITALVLYYFGTGPVKGFAVTLAVGILASMFAALVITRVLVHFSLERGTKEFTVGTWLVTANFDWMGKRKLAYMVSSVLIVGGVGLFGYRYATDPAHIIGIDFTGGVEVQVRMDEPRTKAEIDTLLASADSIAKAGEARAVTSSGSDSGYLQFRVSSKVSGKDQEERDSMARNFSDALKLALADVLQKGPVDVSPRAADGTIELTVYTEDPHPAAALGTLIEDNTALSALTIEADPTRGEGVFVVKAEVPEAVTAGAVQQQITTALAGKKDAAGVAYKLSSPIANESVVGAAVSDELTDSALLAILISLFAVVMYIRVRFTEYSYGFAAVAALAHDVLITLGAIALVNTLGLLELEINLAMIAAFLTIIGYSLNDTIVIFDRVRENRPRMERPLSDILNTSVNQTLSRTILTSLTTFIAVAVLFVANVGTGNTLESFSFAMIVGIITGTYSTIFIANPVFLALETRSLARRAALAKAESSKPATAGA
ncbi:bifunctional preprotein translocase subunit SecD/SecF [Planctomycetes bacterium Pla163]|uniref:Multifunctional fusion protein n=1 Tax=Rohdeia mirabilis TaxID=2528008 RepID=A0A518D306_9BACT|nr:bifunctional preprotein translocase subunit SecD/SecF [Planctomycetes bacterium Pla163]